MLQIERSNKVLKKKTWATDKETRQVIDKMLWILNLTCMVSQNDMDIWTCFAYFDGQRQTVLAVHAMYIYIYIRFISCVVGSTHHIQQN